MDFPLQQQWGDPRQRTECQQYLNGHAFGIALNRMEEAIQNPHQRKTTGDAEGTDAKQFSPSSPSRMVYRKVVCNRSEEHDESTPVSHSSFNFKHRDSMVPRFPLMVFSTNNVR